MSHFDQNKVGKDKWLMQIGTLSGNPIASAAGLKTMEVLRRENMFDKLRKCGNEIMNCLNENLKNANIGHRIVGDPTLFDVLFLDQDVKNYRDTKKADIKLNALFNKGLRMRGIFKSSAKIYPSLAISDEDLLNTKKAIHDTVLNLV
jgi:glutamate-1-semialdehyde 2,1-aminomutase